MPRTRTSEAAQATAGRAIRHARLDGELTQKQLADRMGITPSYLTNLEAGRVNVTVGQLATFAEAIHAGLEIRLPQLPAPPKIGRPA
jgi:transcriptional regulator with XRE-family HTH domain